MNSVLCQTKISYKVPAHTIVVSENLFKKLGLPVGKHITIQLGQRQAKTKILPIHTPRPIIFFSPILSRHLAFPYHGKIRVTYQYGKLQFGPVIGILTTKGIHKPHNPFGEKFFRTFLVAGASQHPVYYVFTPEQIDWKNKTTIGWYYLQGTWKKIRSPLPDVVYERIPNRREESKAINLSCLRRLKFLNIPIFNQGFFDKWTVHNWLAHDPVTKQYVPESHLSPSLRVLKDLLNQHKMIYLKPISGSLGLGIFRITKHPYSGYYIRYHDRERVVLRHYTSLSKIVKQYFPGDRIKRYMAQQGIRLLKHNNSPVDFRVHLHKDHTGDWKVITIGAKNAGLGCVTTHVRTGGKILSTEGFLQSLFSNQMSDIKQKIEQASIEIAQVVEENCEGPVGELGLDVGIDHKGRFWVFECNSKPGRHIFHHPAQRLAGWESAQHVALYSLKLSHFA